MLSSKISPLPHPHLGSLPTSQVCRRASAGAKIASSISHSQPNKQERLRHVLAFPHTGFSLIKNTQTFVLCTSQCCVSSFFFFLPVALMNNSRTIFFMFLPSCNSRIHTMEAWEIYLRGVWGCALGPSVSELRRWHSITWSGLCLAVLVFCF